MNEEWQREARQRRLIDGALSGYRAGKTGLQRLISDLEALTLELVLVSNEWRDQFQALVNDLEATYSVALYRGVVGSLPPDFQADVDDTVEHLIVMMEALGDGPSSASDADEL